MSLSLLCKIFHYLFLWYIYHILWTFFFKINAQVIKNYVLFRNHMIVHEISIVICGLIYVLFRQSLLKVFFYICVEIFCLFLVFLQFVFLCLIVVAILTYQSHCGQKIRCVFITFLDLFRLYYVMENFRFFFHLYTALHICSLYVISLKKNCQMPIYVHLYMIPNFAVVIFKYHLSSHLQLPSVIEKSELISHYNRRCVNFSPSFI